MKPKQMNGSHLIEELDKWSKVYEFKLNTSHTPSGSVGFMTICKNDVDLITIDGYYSIRTILVKTLEYIYKINRIK